MIVMKFGGTSVEDAAAIERVAGIVGERLAQQPVVIVSAFGLLRGDFDFTGFFQLYVYFASLSVTADE